MFGLSGSKTTLPSSVLMLGAPTTSSSAKRSKCGQLILLDQVLVRRLLPDQRLALPTPVVGRQDGLPLTTTCKFRTSNNFQLPFQNGIDSVPMQLLINQVPLKLDREAPFIINPPPFHHFVQKNLLKKPDT